MKKRQLIAPTVLSLILCGLLTDYLYFRQSPWSATNLIGKILSVILAIGVSLLAPVLGLIGNIGIPAAIIAVILILLFFAIARAKAAMRKATPNPDLTLPAAAQVRPASQIPQIPVVQAQGPGGLPLPRLGLLGKLTLWFGCIGILFCVLVWIIAESFVSGVFEKDVKSRAEIISLGLGEIASRNLSSGRIQDLAVQVANQALNDRVAYIYIEDLDGRVVVNEPKDLLIYLNRDFPRSAAIALNGIRTQYRGVEVYEMARRLASDQGFVHVGVWQSGVEPEFRLAASQIAVAIAIVLVVFVAVFRLVVRYLNRPFFDLVERAERISKGDLALPLEIKSADEIGDIARSLERMRSSLRAVTARLEKALDETS